MFKKIILKLHKQVQRVSVTTLPLYFFISRANIRNKYTLPELPYEYTALEPCINADIMFLHHQKHHQAYIANYNIAEEKLQDALSKNDTTTIIALQPALRFNGGGHINHSIFWNNLSPHGGKPSEDLVCAINRDFGSMENMKSLLSASAMGVLGSGWGWLAYNKTSKRLQIASCANQDPLEGTTGMTRFLVVCQLPPEFLN